jgi:hypothetical protein
MSLLTVPSRARAERMMVTRKNATRPDDVAEAEDRL